MLLAAAAAWLFAWRRPIEAVAPPARIAFDAGQVRRGAALAAVGNCQGCHTTPDGRPHAGGVPLPTPFGTVYGSNITPDAETGIGRWSLAAFRRALHEGVGRGGEHLYPVFPYDHYTHLTDADVESLYAYVMTRDPVRAVPPANDLVFPLRFRPLLAGWKLLYFREGGVAATAAGAATTAASTGAPSTMPTMAARGDYLMEALGHCGGCHSPRNALGAERRGAGAAYAGGEAEGWYAPALDTRSPSPVRWTADRLEQYLRTGIAVEHAISAGPMQSVTHELAWADPADVRAIAERVAAMMGDPAPEKRAVEAASRERAAAAGSSPVHAGAVTATSGGAAAGVEGGAAPGTPGGTTLDAGGGAASGTVDDGDVTFALGRSVYAGACAGCHDTGRGVSSNAALQLPLAVAVRDPDPRSLIRIVRLGIVPPDGEARRCMPAFEGAFTDEQLTALLAFLRRQAAGAPPWPDLGRAVREAHRQSAADVRIANGR